MTKRYTNHEHISRNSTRFVVLLAQKDAQFLGYLQVMYRQSIEMLGLAAIPLVETYGGCLSHRGTPSYTIYFSGMFRDFPI